MIPAEQWNKILNLLRTQKASIEILLRSTKPLQFDKKNLKLGVFYKFHKDKLDEPANKIILEGVFESIYQTPIKIECLLTVPDQSQPVELVENKADEITKAAEEIFS